MIRVYQNLAFLGQIQEISIRHTCPDLDPDSEGCLEHFGRNKMELHPDILKGQRVQDFHDCVDDDGNHKAMGLQPTKRIQSFEHDPPLDDQVIDRLVRRVVCGSLAALLLPFRSAKMLIYFVHHLLSGTK